MVTAILRRAGKWQQWTGWEESPYDGFGMRVSKEATFREVIWQQLCAVFLNLRSLGMRSVSGIGLFIGLDLQACYQNEWWSSKCQTLYALNTSIKRNVRRASLPTKCGPCQGIPGLSLVYYQPVKRDSVWRLYSGDNYLEMDVHKLVTNYSGFSIVDCRWVVWSYRWWRIWAYPGAIAGLSHNICWLISNSRHTYATNLGAYQCKL